MSDTRRTKRRYAHELYPHPGEGELRPLEVEVPYLYAHAQGMQTWGTSWFDMLGPSNPMEARLVASGRINHLVGAGHLALLADALLQGLAGQKAWDWATARTEGDVLGYWVCARGTHYGVDLARIKPYPCGPEPDHHDHMASTGDVMGQGVITRIDCPESECPTCTEPIDSEADHA